MKISEVLGILEDAETAEGHTGCLTKRMLRKEPNPTPFAYRGELGHRECWLSGQIHRHENRETFPSPRRYLGT